MCKRITALGRMLESVGWLIAIVVVAIGFAVCYRQYRAVHDSQERHSAHATIERQETIRLDRQILVVLREGHAVSH